MQRMFRGCGRSARRPVLVALTLVVPAALAAGCGSSGPSTTNSASTSNPRGNAVTAAYAYARCMRSHGVPGFPDPHVSVSPGRVAIGFHVTPAETGSPSFKSASQACQHVLPAPNNRTPAQQRARTAGLLAFARCIRAKGIAGFPDPDAQGQLTLRMLSAAGIDIHSRKVLDTAKACVGASHGAIKLSDVEAAVNRAQ